MAEEGLILASRETLIYSSMVHSIPKRKFCHQNKIFQRLSQKIIGLAKKDKFNCSQKVGTFSFCQALWITLWLRKKRNTYFCALVVWAMPTGGTD